VTDKTAGGVEGSQTVGSGFV